MLPHFRQWKVFFPPSLASTHPHQLQVMLCRPRMPRRPVCHILAPSTLTSPVPPRHHLTHRLAVNLPTARLFGHLPAVEAGEHYDIESSRKPQSGLLVAIIDKVTNTATHPSLSMSHRIALSCGGFGSPRDEVVEDKSKANKLLSILGTYFATSVGGGVPV